MHLVYAEKPSMAVLFASALGGIPLGNGLFAKPDQVSMYKKQIEAIQRAQGCFYVSFAGQDYCVTWGYGHLGTLKDAKDYNPAYVKWSEMPMPFFPQKYEVKPAAEKVAQFTRVARLFNDKSVDYVINATDYEREGELIFAYVYQLSGCSKPFYRLKFNKATEAAVQAAFNNLESAKSVQNLTYAARGRAIADWMVGINLTVAATMQYRNRLALKKGEVASIGRVITPTLAMIVKRERDVVGFTPSTFWTLEGTFTCRGESFTARSKQGRFDTEAEAQTVMAALAGKPATVTLLKQTTEKKNPPNPYDLTALQKLANKEYGMTAQATLDAAQKLYEGNGAGGYITYPRTDSQYFTEDLEAEYPKLLRGLARLPEYAGFVGPALSKSSLQKRYFDNSKVEAHGALAITEVIPKAGALTEDQRKVYDLIAKAFIRLAYPPAVAHKTEVEVTVGNVVFACTGTKVSDQGWMVVDAAKTVKNHIPASLKKGDVLDAEYKVATGTTSPPERFDDASLLDAMRTCGKKVTDEELKKMLAAKEGIGRPSTRADCIERLIRLGYIDRKGKKIFPTERGCGLIDVLPLESLKSAELTGRWEMKLESIASGAENVGLFIAEMQEQTMQWCREIGVDTGVSAHTASGLLCPACGQPVLESAYGYQCSNTGGCKFMVGKTVCGTPLSRENVKRLCEKKRSDLIRNMASKRSANTFNAYLVVEPDGKVSFDYNSGMKCPKCGGEIRVGRFGYGCDNWKAGCIVQIPFVLCGHVMSESEVETLLNAGKTDMIADFQKKGNPEAHYSAALTLNSEGRIEFSFPPRRTQDAR